MTQKKPFTVNDFFVKKSKGQQIVMLTAYDAVMAALVEEAGVDAILVGDSVANCVLGYENTLPVDMEDMVRHTAAVTRGLKQAFVVADLPFMSYQASEDSAVANAGRLVKEGGAQAVKLEGGKDFAALVRRLVHSGIPVMGHIGLIPQSVHAMGGYRVQGRNFESARDLIHSATALQEAGAFSIVLEGIPRQLARSITTRLSIPTIGIGAGRWCDGQILVINDILGMTVTRRPKFVRTYANLSETIVDAVGHYVSDVREGEFPSEKESYTMGKSEWDLVRQYCEEDTL